MHLHKIREKALFVSAQNPIYHTGTDTVKFEQHTTLFNDYD